MPIEFDCDHCHHRLRVADEHAGKAARCPACQIVVPIPTPPAKTQIPLAKQNYQPGPSASSAAQPQTTYRPGSARPPSRSAEQSQLRSASHTHQSGQGLSGSAGPSNDANSDESRSAGGLRSAYPLSPGQGVGGTANNPYQSPATSKTAEFQEVSGGAVSPRAAGIEEIFKVAWNAWKENLGLMIGAFLGQSLVPHILTYLIAALLYAMEAANVPQIFVVLVNVFGGLSLYALSVFLNIGYMKICLNLVRQQPAEFTMLFSGADRMLPFIGLTLLTTAAIFAGFLLLVVPGIILTILFSLMLWTCLYLVVDGKCKVLESIAVSWQIGKLNVVTTIVLFLISMGLVLIGALLCLIGLLFALPLMMLLFAAGYAKMSGQI
jgi:hypothetical protein